MSPVRYEVSGSTVTLVLDEPSNRNAITPALLEGIASGLKAAEEDARIRAVVLTHTGNTFCAGADLSGGKRGKQGSAGAAPTEGTASAEGGQSGAAAGARAVSAEGAAVPQRADSGGGDPADPTAEQRERGRAAADVCRALLESPKPVIAALDGHVRAGGMGFVAACDVVLAGPRATFGVSEVRIGVVAAMIAPLVLARLGDRTAAEWFLRGSAVSAAEAASAGFVTRAVPAGAEAEGEVSGGAGAARTAASAAGGSGAGASEGGHSAAATTPAYAPPASASPVLAEALEEVLGDLRKAAPAALAASKRLVNRRVLRRMDEEGEEMLDLSASFFLSDDARAGMAAFLAKESPPWVVSE
ncbi:enoyl-CoA hydratase-related protein [Brevibacterium album]|uniref:enoyl-CoA hydratase-related protein n=1 Tax=Brevibacterium album TaxID=417948 RepID=UPI00048DA1AD|nr:enoyl-CoA hydratase-related protein [Brevibacterium album]